MFNIDPIEPLDVVKATMRKPHLIELVYIAFKDARRPIALAEAMARISMQRRLDGKIRVGTVEALQDYLYEARTLQLLEITGSEENARFIPTEAFYNVLNTRIMEIREKLQSFAKEVEMARFRKSSHP